MQINNKRDIRINIRGWESVSRNTTNIRGHGGGAGKFSVKARLLIQNSRWQRTTFTADLLRANVGVFGYLDQQKIKSKRVKIAEGISLITVWDTST